MVYRFRLIRVEPSVLDPVLSVLEKSVVPVEVAAVAADRLSAITSRTYRDQDQHRFDVPLHRLVVLQPILRVAGVVFQRH